MGVFYIGLGEAQVALHHRHRRMTEQRLKRKDIAAIA